LLFALHFCIFFPLYLSEAAGAVLLKAFAPTNLKAEVDETASIENLTDFFQKTTNNSYLIG